MAASLKDKLKNLSVKSLTKSLASVWRRIFTFVAWTLLLLSIGFITYVGYTSLQVEQGNEEKDQIYIQGQEAKARFNDRSYEDLRNVVKERAEKAETNPSQVADIFYTPGVGETEEEDDN